MEIVYYLSFNIAQSRYQVLEVMITDHMQNTFPLGETPFLVYVSQPQERQQVGYSAIAGDK